MLERVEGRPTGAALRSSGMAVAELIRRIEAGEALDGIEPADAIAALAWPALHEGAEGPPLVQAPSGSEIPASVLSERRLAPLLPDASRPARLAMAAGLLQVHDYWDASHEAAQQADDLGERDVSAYWHGIAHRREPDPGNASYWFRRVGKHPLFRPLGATVAGYLRDQGQARLADRIAPGGQFDPLAFIDFCGAARHGTAESGWARHIQKLEMTALLKLTAEKAGVRW